MPHFHTRPTERRTCSPGTNGLAALAQNLGRLGRARWVFGGRENGPWQLKRCGMRHGGLRLRKGAADAPIRTRPGGKAIAGRLPSLPKSCWNRARSSNSQRLLDGEIRCAVRRNVADGTWAALESDDQGLAAGRAARLRPRGHSRGRAWTRKGKGGLMIPASNMEGSTHESIW